VRAGPALHEGPPIKRWSKPLRGRLNSKKLQLKPQHLLAKKLQVQRPFLHPYRLIINQTPWDSMEAMRQAFSPITEANRKEKMKNGRTYLL
jgi:hypothetical protein